MTSTAPVLASSFSAPPMSTAGAVRTLRLFPDLEHPRSVLMNITPNWYASIMGTGIIAVAAASLPLQLLGLQLDGLRTVATIIWAVAALLLIGLTVVTALHWRHHQETARGHLSNPVMGNFYGAPPMAMMTVGAGTLLLGKDVIGLPAALCIDWVLWTTGTLAGLICAVVVPYLMITRHHVMVKNAFGGWLMPVVPPMVSASTGALLIPHVSDSGLRIAMVLGCYVMFGMSLLASLIVISLLWRRLSVHGVGPAAMVPTLWIVLGPLGQSVTAANLLGSVAHEALPEASSVALQNFGVLYGVPVLIGAMFWACLAATITIRTAREHLPFSLTWWSFTFPVGTCVTGTTALAVSTGSTVLAAVALMLFVGLVVAWVIVAVRTAHGSLRGFLFLPAVVSTVR